MKLARPTFLITFLFLGVQTVFSADPNLEKALKDLEDNYGNIPLFKWSIKVEKKKHAENEDSLKRQANLGGVFATSAKSLLESGRFSSKYTVTEDPPTHKNDFREPYNADSANKRKQSWEDYWDWVTDYYEGKWPIDGWNDYVAELSNREDVVVWANVLARVMAAEWSKDNGVRNINSDDIKAWGNEIDASSDAGANRQLLTLQAVASKAARKLR